MKALLVILISVLACSSAVDLVPRLKPVKIKGAFTPFLVLKNPHNVPPNYALTNVVLVAQFDADLWQSFISPKIGWHWAGFLGAGQRLEIPIEIDQPNRFLRLIYSYPDSRNEPN